MDTFKIEQETPAKSETADQKQQARTPVEKSTVKLETAGELRRAIASGDSVEFEVRAKVMGATAQAIIVKLDMVSSGTDEGSPEWFVKVFDAIGILWDSSSGDEPVLEFELQPEHEKTLTIMINSPSGARYGDRINLIVNANLKNDPGASDSVAIQVTARQSIMAIKTSIGHEKAVADSLASRAKPKNVGVFAILSPATLRGYVLVEAMNTDALKDLVKGVRKTRGIVQGETTLDEIDHFLTPKPIVSGIIEGDIVELISGPFKGEKARVQHIDENKEEITVELFEAMVPIPITVKGDHVRVIEKERS
ncbi:MAG: transcription elongation factor Spt5 [Thermoplasmata archaeon]|nr:transcription elongation factor Spt5 [Thermoplasmata archaeon]